MKFIACLIAITLVSLTLAAGEDRTAFDLVNNYRKQNSKGPLAWEQSLANLAQGHSQNMAAGKVPFGHDGFDQRYKSIPFKTSGASENVAMNQGVANAAKTAVDSWINSSGHRANMLGDSNVAGMGVAKSGDGKWYFTQLFAKKN